VGVFIASVAVVCVLLQTGVGTPRVLSHAEMRTTVGSLCGCDGIQSYDQCDDSDPCHGCVAAYTAYQPLTCPILGLTPSGATLHHCVGGEWGTCNVHSTVCATNYVCSKGQHMHKFCGPDSACSLDVPGFYCVSCDNAGGVTFPMGAPTYTCD